MDGQTKAANRSLSNLLCCLIQDNTASWDLILPQAEFAFNNSVNHTTRATPFFVVYGLNPRTPLDINSLPLPTKVSETGLDFSKYISTLHDDIKRKITTNTAEYTSHVNLKKRDVQFAVGNQVLVRLRPKRFHLGSFTKLYARRAGLFSLLKRLGPNACVIDLPEKFTFSHIFNVEDLSAFNGMNDQDDKDPVTNPRISTVSKHLDFADAILDHQFISTRRGDCYKFLVRWAAKPLSEAVWLQAPEIQRLNPELFKTYT
ncbi:hypothetical protein ACOSQ4_010607 [Xanthoceras sorbifolium]